MACCNVWALPDGAFFHKPGRSWRGILSGLLQRCVERIRGNTMFDKYHGEMASYKN